MARSARPTFTEHLFSAATLTPLVLGICAALAIWGFNLVPKPEGAGTRLALFLAAVGALGAVGTLLTLRVMSAREENPALVKKRKELLGLLDALADGAQHGPAPEPDLATAAAPIERA